MSPEPGYYINSTRLGDGCRHVFIDAGSNRGVHVRFLTEPRAFPHSRYLNAWRFFQNAFGEGFADDATICAFGFEPNPAHTARLDALGLRLRAHGRRVEFFHAALSNHTGSISFTRGDGISSDWGFRASPMPRANYKRHAKRASDEQQQQQNDAGRAEPSPQVVHVPLIDLGRFVADELVARQLPQDRLSGGDTPPARPPAIVMKMDVEGGEYDALTRLASLNVLCQIDVLSLEVHNLGWARLNASSLDAPASARLATFQEAMWQTHEPLWRTFAALEPPEGTGWGALQPFVERATRSRARGAPHQRHQQHDMRTASSGCRTRVFLRDDESYLLVPDVPRGEWS